MVRRWADELGRLNFAAAVTKKALAGSSKGVAAHVVSDLKVRPSVSCRNDFVDFRAFSR